MMSNISKTVRLRDKVNFYLLWNTNRKLYPVYRMVRLSMTLIDWNSNRDIFDTEYLRNDMR